MKNSDNPNDTTTNTKNCCENKDANEGKKEKKKGIWQGIAYGTIPHLGCIMFIIASILGITLLTNLFKPLLMNRNFFYWLFVISFGLATLSSLLYLKKNKMLSLEGIKIKKVYLAIMYGSTIGINLFLFLFIFPVLANISFTGAVVSSTSNSNNELNKIILQVDIPCSGHAPLITQELKSIKGVNDVRFSFPNKFEISYTSERDEEKILSLDVFNEYPAKVIKESLTDSPTISDTQTREGTGSCCGGGCGVR